MKGIGLREVVGLAVLVAAVVVAGVFIDPSKSESDAPVAPVTVDPSQPTPAPRPTRTPTPAPTPTEAPPLALAFKELWMLQFFQVGANGQLLTGSTVPTFAEMLDVSFPAPPFPDFKPGAWGVRAETSVAIPSEGRYTFAVEHDCALRILIDGSEVASDDDGPSPRTLQATFRHAAGTAQVTLECRHTTGGFALRAK